MCYSDFGGKKIKIGYGYDFEWVTKKTWHIISFYHFQTASKVKVKNEK